MATKRGTRPDLSADEAKIVGKPGDLVSEERVPARAASGSVIVSLRIDRRTVDALSRLAERRGESFSTTTREAIRTYLRREEEGKSYPEAAQRPSARRVAEGGARSWQDDDLRAALVRYETACRGAGMRETATRSYVDYARRFIAWREGDYQPRGIPAGDRPVPRAAVTTSDLRQQARQYADEVQAAGREQPTVDTYFRHAMFFIRWLAGDFEPGARLQGLR